MLILKNFNWYLIRVKKPMILTKEECSFGLRNSYSNQEFLHLPLKNVKEPLKSYQIFHSNKSTSQSNGINRVSEKWSTQSSTNHRSTNWPKPSAEPISLHLNLHNITLQILILPSKQTSILLIKKSY